MSESLWWEGPKWLKDPLNWDKENEYSLNGEGTVPEINKGDTSVMVGNVTPNELLPIWCANTYKKQLMLFVGFVRYFSFIRSGKTEKFTKHVTKDEYNKAEVLAIKTMQKESLAEEFALLKAGKKVKKGPFAQIKLFLDDRDIIRCHGRLSGEKFEAVNTPVLFHNKHPLTKLYTWDKHRCYNCAGTAATLTKVMRDIHTNGLKGLVGQVIRKCITCQKLLAHPYKYPENPLLPNYRLICEKPFSMCGVDYIGPFKSEVVNTDGETDLSIQPAEGRNVSRTSHKLYVVILLA